METINHQQFIDWKAFEEQKNEMKQQRNEELKAFIMKEVENIPIKEYQQAFADYMMILFEKKDDWDDDVYGNASQPDCKTCQKREIMNETTDFRNHSDLWS